MATAAHNPNSPLAAGEFFDRQIHCKDCGEDFVFTVSEQRFFQSKGFTNDPARCAKCRGKRRSSTHRGMRAAGR